MERRLAAIMLTDIVGFSRLVGLDEEGTITRQKEHRNEIIDPSIAQHGGRIVKTTGDGLLVEFASVIDAVRCAIEVQSELAGRDIQEPSERRIQYRIGINLGDIIIDGDDILGDGVNVAARLEGLASPGGICISGTVHDQLDGKIDVEFESTGERSVKNIAKPVHVWQWPATGVAEFVSEASEKPSIAVLAFENMSPNPEHTFFGDGLAEDIITTLSRISSLLVVARNSSFTYKGKAVDLRTVGRELGVGHVLEGSVQAAGGRLRVNAQLTDASTGRHVWAERYDRKIDDLFAIQDEITREIVTALRARLSDGEEAQLWLHGTSSIEAWSEVMAVHDCIFDPTSENIAEAHQCLTRAIGHDPDYAAAYALVGLVKWIELRFGLAHDRVHALEEMGVAATRAAELDETNALAQIVLAGHAQSSGDGAKAYALGRRAIELSPSNSFVRVAYGRILIFLDRPSEAEEHLRLAFRLNPYGPVQQHSILANSLERQGKDEEAITVLREATKMHPDFVPGHLRLASMLGLSGAISEAKQHIAEARHLRPDLDRTKLEAFYGNDDQQSLTRFLDGLERAGFQPQ